MGSYVDDFTEAEGFQRLEHTLVEVLYSAARLRRGQSSVFEGAEPLDVVFAREVDRVLGQPKRIWDQTRPSRDAPYLPFEDPHKVWVEQYRALQSGMYGGPDIDLLLQVWIDTESTRLAFGVPIIMRDTPARGPVPAAIWADVSQIAKSLNRTTPCGRFGFASLHEPFQGPTLGDIHWDDVRLFSGLSIEGARSPLRPSQGMFPGTFFADLVSGWGGDPFLSGRLNHPVQDEFFKLYNVRHVVRVILAPIKPSDPR